jgi:hypothetical protein
MKRSLSTLFALLLAPVALAACGAGDPGAAPVASSTPSSPVEATASPGEPGVDSPTKPEILTPADCPVTIPTIFVPPPGYTAQSLFGAATSYGNGQLFVGGLGQDGVITPAIELDGTRSTKLGWLRVTPGQLNIIGRRLDGPAATLTANVPEGYGEDGFQSTGVSFPTAGCWEITGKSGSSTLTFVTYVKP